MQGISAPGVSKWKVEEANWMNYKKEINLEKNFESFSNPMAAYKYFTESMIKSANNNIPKTSGKLKRPAVPWWNKTCSTMRKITRKCFRRYKSSGSPIAKVTYLRNQAKQEILQKS